MPHADQLEADLAYAAALDAAARVPREDPLLLAAVAEGARAAARDAGASSAPAPEAIGPKNERAESFEVRILPARVRARWF